jgi:hypothetical protein
MFCGSTNDQSDLGEGLRSLLRPKASGNVHFDFGISYISFRLIVVEVIVYK